MGFSNIIRYCALIACHAVVPFLSAGQQAQMVFEDAWFSGEWLNHTISTADNGHVIGILDDRKIKLDVAGDALWCKAYQFQTYLERATPDSGTISLSYPEFTLHYGPSQDTLVMHFSLMKLDASGEVEWARAFSSEFLGAGVSMDLYDSFHLDADEEGRIAVALQCNAVTPRPIWVVCLDQGGEVIWSRTIADPNPSLSKLSVALDGDGAMYVLSWYSSTDLWDPAEFDLFKFTADGVLGWTRRGTTLDGGIKGGSLICSNGHPVIGALEASGFNFYGYIISLQSSGYLGWLKRYFGPGSTSDPQFDWELHSLANGEMIAVHYGHNNQWCEELIARIAENGNVIAASREVPMDIGGYSFHVDWGGIDVRAGTVAIAASVHRQAPWDPQPGLPGLWTLGLGLNGCMLAPASLSATSFNSFVSLVSANPFAYSEAEYDSVDLEVSVMDESMPPTGDACDLPMIIGSPTEQHGTFDVSPVLVARGDPIQIQSSSAGTLEVRDPLGRCFFTMRVAANVPAVLSTSGLCSGTYLLGMMNGADGQVRVRRLFVE